MFLPYLQKYNFIRSSGDHNLKGLFLLGCVNRSFFFKVLLLLPPVDIFLWSNLGYVFNIPCKGQRKIWTGGYCWRQYKDNQSGNRKVFFPIPKMLLNCLECYDKRVCLPSADRRKQVDSQRQNRGGARERGKSDKLTFMLVEWRWIDRSFFLPP